MNCPEAHDWLLQAEDPRQCIHAGVAEHVRACAHCLALRTQLVELEQTYRTLPAPDECEAARAAFLRRLPAHPPRQRFAGLVRWAVAALLVLGVGVAFWCGVPAPQATAAPLLIEQLVDLNLRLAETPTAAERARLEPEQQRLLTAIEQRPLAEADQALATLLLDNSAWLIANDDPVGKAERFAAVADQLVARAQAAADRRDQQAVDRYVQLQSQVAERGVSASLARAEEAGVLNFENERRLEKVILRDSRRMKTLIDLMERDPDLSRREIRLALDLPMKPAAGPASLVFEVHADDNPARVGLPTTYHVTLLNQGAAGLGRCQLLVALPAAVEFLSVRGPGHVRRDASGILLAPVQLGPKAELRYEIQVMPRQPGEARCRVELRGKQLGGRPLWRTQQTTIVSD